MLSVLILPIGTYTVTATVEGLNPTDPVEVRVRDRRDDYVKFYELLPHDTNTLLAKMPVERDTDVTFYLSSAHELLSFLLIVTNFSKSY